MKIKWQISIALVLLCIIMIAMLSGITMMQLKGSVEQERDDSIARLTKQTTLSFSYISDDLEHYLFNISRSEGVASILTMSEDRKTRLLQINRFLQSITDSTYYIQSAYVLDEENGDFYSYAGAGACANVEEVEDRYRDGFFKTDKDSQWFRDNQGYVYVSRAIYKMYPYKRIGSVIAQINQGNIFTMVGIDKANDGVLCIFDADHRMVIDGSSELYDRELLLEAYHAGINSCDRVVSTDYAGEEYDVYVHSQKDHGWNAMFLISRREKLASYYEMNSGIWKIGAVLIVLSIAFSYVISYSLAKRTSSMVLQVQQIGQAQPEKRIVISGKDEIAELADSFNKMLDEIENMYQQILNQQIEEDNVRYELLDLQFRSIQAQIAPHFISNILGALNSYAAAGKTEKVEQLVVHSSRYIRKNMESIDRKMSTVEEEFRTIDEYIALYQNVFGEPREYRKTFLNEECRTMMMPSLLLQPLVENALKYYRNDGNAAETHICLTAQLSERKLILGVEDTSGELPQDVLDALRQMMTEGTDTSNRLGFGLSGIVRRLRILYPDQFAFRVSSLEKKHKRIEIAIPAVTDEEYYGVSESVIRS